MGSKRSMLCRTIFQDIRLRLGLFTPNGFRFVAFVSLVSLVCGSGCTCTNIGHSWATANSFQRLMQARFASWALDVCSFLFFFASAVLASLGLMFTNQRFCMESNVGGSVTVHGCCDG